LVRGESGYDADNEPDNEEDDADPAKRPVPILIAETKPDDA
jgi:hypothetical protein